MKNMKLFMLLILSFGLISFSKFRQEKDDQLSGQWVINIAKSNFGKLSADEGAAKEMKISLTEDSIITERKFSSSLSREVYRYDGTSIVKELSNQTRKTSYFTWIIRGKVFSINGTYDVYNNGDPWQYIRTETYTLSDDGKTLTLERVTKIPDRTDVVKAIYDRI